MMELEEGIEKIIIDGRYTTRDNAKAIAERIASALVVDEEKVKVFNKNTLSDVFERRMTKKPQGDYVDLVGLHHELNEILASALSTADIIKVRQ